MTDTANRGTTYPAVLPRHESMPDGAGRGWPTPARSWYATVIFTLAYILAFVDRQILSLLVIPIQADLGLSDTQISLLIGAAFAICYATFGLPLGWAVDRISRRWVAAAGVTFWSVMAAGCGLAGSFPQLFLARMGVGLGEASLTPAAYSYLSDSFPPAKLVRALSVYMSGAMIGIALAYALGGEFAAWVAARDTVTLPLIGVVRAWQAPFLILLPPGLLIGVLVLLMAEPPRRKIPGPATTASIRPFLKSRGVPFGLLFLAMGAQSIVINANLAWMPTLLARTFAWDSASIGYALGGVFLVAGLGGNLLGAWIGGCFLDARRTRAYLGICTASAALLCVVAPLGALADSAWVVLACFAPTILFIAIPTSIVPAALQMTTPGEFRGRVSAAYIFSTQMLGLLLGPTMVAIFTDFVFADRAAIGYSQAATATFGALVSLGAFFAASAPFTRLAKESPA